MGFAALAAVEGHEGFGAFVDYRDEPVLAAVAKLDRAPWGIVVKVDQREALAGYQHEVRQTGGTAVAAFVGFWALVFLLVLGWRRRAEAALREGEERYRATLYSIGDAVIATDQHGRVKQMNPVAARLTGWAEAEAQGRPLDDVFHIVNEETHAVVESPVARVLREGKVIGLANHTLLIGKDGNEHPIADSGAPIRNEKGETTGVVLVFRDQTEERAAQRSLQESERRYRTLAESLPHLVWTSRADGPCDYLSPRWVDYTGIPEADQLGYRWLEQLHPDDRERVIAEWGEIAPRGGVFDIEFRIRRADGAYRWFRTRAIPFRDADGRVVKWFGSNSDIDERKRAEAALREGEERYRATLYSIGDAVIATDEGGRVKQMNPVAEKLTGWTESQASGRPLDEVFRIVNEETHAVVESPVARVLREGQVVGLANHSLLIGKDGRERPIADSGAPIRNEKGETTGVVLVFRDQTEERAAQNALKESEAFNRTIVESIPQQLFLKDRNGVYLAVNPPYAASLGCRPEQLVGKDDFAFYPTELAEKYRADDRAVVESGRVKDIEERYIAQGKEYWVHTIKAPVSDDGGQVTAVLGLFEDITGRKRVEQSLKDAWDRIEEAQRAAHLGNWEFDVLNDQITGSQEFYRLFDMVPEGLSRFSQFVERLHPDDRERVQRDVADALKQDRPYDTDYRVKLSDGGWRDVIARGRVFVDEGGKPLRMVGTCLDITERKQAENALREQYAILRAILQSTDSAVFSLDRQYRYTTFNDGHAATMKALYGVDIQIGASLAEYRSVPEDWQVARKNLDRALQGETFVESAFSGDEVRSRRYFEISHSPIRTSANEIIGASVYSRDVTERKRAEDEIRLLNVSLELRVRDRTAQLEESNKELEAFSYSVSHDLRAPLRAIDGFTRLLADDYAPHLDTEGKRLCSIIHENTAKMGRLIDDLLAFSRLGRAEMSLSRIDMETMANSVFHELTTPESRARIDFQVGVLPPVVADTTLMRQVWMNLLSNAIKFSSKRERAVIQVSAQQNQGENVYVVQDNGAGFDMQYVGKLFGVFQRLHSSREFEGTGVGLALVQRVIRRHGGRVWAESEIDKGATFYFALQQRGA
jgi:PAS domain S-box-containing protein